MKKYFADAEEARAKIMKIIESYPGLIDAICVSIQNGSFTKTELQTELNNMPAKLIAYVETYLSANYPKTKH